MKKQDDLIYPKHREQANNPDINKENQDHEFPGYPHYPAQQDILEGDSGAIQADIDIEDISRATLRAARGETKLGEFADDLRDDLRIVKGTEADVTEEDLALLGDPALDLDEGDDEMEGHYLGLDDTDFDGDPLNEHAGTLVATGGDLDLPDPELDLNDMDGQDDEENDYFSLGGDGKEGLEEEQPDNV